MIDLTPSDSNIILQNTNSTLNQEENILINGNFVEIKQLGADVILVQNVDNLEILAIKFFPKRTKDVFNKDMFNIEYSVLMSLNHDNILRIKGANLDALYYKPDQQPENILYVASEYAENEDLFSFILKEPFNESIAKTLFKQLLKGVETIHNKKIGHGDIRVENIFLSKEFNLKIGNFGFEKYLETADRLFSSEYHLPPQIFTKEKISNEQIDIFSCGVALFIMVFSTKPFRKSATKNDDFYKYIYKGNYKAFWKNFINNVNKKTISDKLMEFLTSIFKFENCTLETILASDWMKEEIIENNHNSFNMEMIRRKSIIENSKYSKSELEIDLSYYDLNKIESGKRDFDEPLEVENILNKVSNLENFKINEWSKKFFPTFYIICDSVDPHATYKHFLNLLIHENAKIKVSHTEFSFNCSLTYPNNSFYCVNEDEINISNNINEHLEIDSNNNETENVFFKATLYLLKKQKRIMVELIIENGTDYIDMKLFTEYINTK